MKMKKLLALLLSVLMVVSLLPLAAMADDVVLSITGNAEDVFIYFGMDDYRYTDISGDRDLLTDVVDFWEINECITYIKVTGELNKLKSITVGEYTIDVNEFCSDYDINLSEPATGYDCQVVVDNDSSEQIATSMGIAEGNNGSIQYGYCLDIYGTSSFVLFFSEPTLNEEIFSLAMCFGDGIQANCTPTVTSSDTTMGTVATSQGDNTESGTIWTLTATCATGCELRYIQNGEDESTRVTSADGYTITWEVTTDGAAYTAYFGPAVPHLGKISIAGSAALSGFTGNPLSMRIPWSKGSGLPQAARTLYAEAYYISNDTKVTLGKATITQNVDIQQASTDTDGFVLTLDSVPADMTEFTIAAKFGEDGETSYKTVDASTLGIKQSGSMVLAYLDVPGNGMGYYSCLDNGPIVYDMAAFTDAQTGAVTTYFATNAGLVKMKPDGSFATVAGINGAVVAVGGADANHLFAVTAAVSAGSETESSTQYLLWTYDATTDAWTAQSETYTMSHPFISEFDENSFDPIVCVLSADSVWAKDAHWNGEDWTANDVTFNSFWKDGRGAFAGSANGLYRYTGSVWTQVNGISGTTYVVAGARSGENVILLTADTYEPEHRATMGAYTNGVRGVKMLVVAADGSASVTDVDTSAFVENGVYGLKGMAVNGDGEVFGFTNGRAYNGNTYGNYWGTFVYKLTDGAWINQSIDEFNDATDKANITAGKWPSDENGIQKSRPDGVRYSLTPVEGMTYFSGLNGAIYGLYGESTITFDPGEGAFSDASQPTMTAPIFSAIGTRPTPTRKDYVLDGWTYDAEGAKPFTATVMPAKDITVYAKWVQGEELIAQLAFYKEKALGDLETQYKRYSSSDYTAENWAKLQKAYNDGKTAINAAEVGATKVNENIEAALNAAVTAMAAVPKIETIKTDMITVAVSMDANTLGLGYLIEPTLVTVEKGTQASVVIMDLIKQMAAEKYGVTGDGFTTYHESEPAEEYPWMMTGSVTRDFYLSQVYYPEQQNYKLPDFLSHLETDPGFNAGDADGNYLGEFDYMSTSGWVYSIGSKSSGGAKFPGIGASNWYLKDGEVMRWQFTVVGYGSDLNADNTQWGSQSIIPELGDKSALTWKVAEINAAGTKNTYGDDYDKAIAVLTDAEATQKQVDDALAALNAVDNPGSGNTSSTTTGTTTPADETDDGTVEVKPEVKDGEASAEVSAETVADALKDSEDADALTVKVDTEDADSVELALPADAVKAAAEAEVGLNVETENGTVKLDADTLGELAESGKDVAVTVSANEDGTTTIDVTADGESVDAKVKVELPAAEDNQVLVIVNADGSETVVKKSLVEDGKAYAEIPAGATVKVVENDKEFGDVKGDEWYAEAVEFVASHELFQGTDNGFEPGLTMNRAMLATVLYRLEDAAATGESSFDDVDQESWYADAAAWAEETGIINGTDKGFEPDANVSREQIATILYRYVNYLGIDVSGAADLSAFSDGGDTAPWAKEAMAWAVEAGLFKGDDTGALDPKGDATRAEVAALMQRLVGLLVK